MNSNYDNKSTAQGCGLLIVLLFIGVIFIRSCGSSGETNQNNKVSIDYMDVFLESERFVEKRLKSPYSAKYCHRTEDKITVLNDSTFLVHNCFDSKNSFGAMIRSNYSCKITFLEKSGIVKCENLSIN